jgi:long-subunit fatty acid transport protein
MYPGLSLRSLTALAALTLISMAQSHAIGIKSGNQDAAATARGNAFTATTDNPSAVYCNPAGLTQLEGDQVSMGAYFLKYHVDYTGPQGSERAASINSIPCRTSMTLVTKKMLPWPGVSVSMLRLALAHNGVIRLEQL